MQRLFADESVFGPTVVALRHAGWDVVRAVDICQSAPDEQVLHEAFIRQRIVITEDFDFGDLVIRCRLKALGLIISALGDVSVELKPQIVIDALLRHKKTWSET